MEMSAEDSTLHQNRCLVNELTTSLAVRISKWLWCASQYGVI